MHLRYGVLADAVVSSGGKWNALGTFNVIRVRDTPAVHRSAGLLLRLAGDRRDIGDHELEIRFVNDLGETVGDPFKLGFTIREEAGEGLPIEVDFGVNLEKFPIPTTGPFDFVVFVDGRYLDSIPVHVRKLPA